MHMCPISDASQISKHKILSSEYFSSMRKRYPLNHDNSVPITWSNGNKKALPQGKQFDSDSQNLMLDDGMLACITNDKDDLIEPPKYVDCKVRGI